MKDLNGNRMSIFNKIDSKLIEFASKIGARITMDRPGYPEELRTFEERRIYWTDNEICKAIIIQPTFRATGVDSTMWNMISIAWFEDIDSKTRLQWVEDLICEKEFKYIESDIEKLIEKSYVNLSRLTINDLKNN
jgi:hypothetical protein